MTHQLAERIIIDPGASLLPEMLLFGVLVGNIDDPKSWSGYAFATKGDSRKLTSFTGLWRGWVSTYRLTTEGTLILEQLEYPFTDGAAPDQVSETVNGDFWLDFRESFFGAATRVPFIDGHIQCDRSQWRHMRAENSKLPRPTTVPTTQN
jgi:hypothetical protein